MPHALICVEGVRERGLTDNRADGGGECRARRRTRDAKATCIYRVLSWLTRRTGPCRHHSLQSICDNRFAYDPLALRREDVPKGGREW
jgi:hypothetical protein